MSDQKILGAEYAERRNVRLSHRYRLHRRTREVKKSIDKWMDTPWQKVLDIGAADGKMINALSQFWPAAQFIGYEYSKELVKYAATNYPGVQIIHGDAHKLAFPDHCFDLVIATAVLEHLSDPAQAVREAGRVLRPRGIIIITAPDPFWERIATKIGHLDNDQHAHVMSISQISALLIHCGFRILETKKFMLSPVGFFFEETIEKFLCKMGCGFLLANQLIVAQVG